MIQLTYGHTNTFLIEGSNGYLLVDTDYAGKLSAFYQAIKQHRIKVKDIAFVMATHYHPDHMGLIGDLMKQGVKLLLFDAQKSAVHFSDVIFDRDGIAADPIDETQATIISCKESRSFLRNIGIAGQIIHTPSHSEDSVSLILDDGRFFVGDLEPFEFIESYTDNDRLRKDWETLLSFNPQKIYYAHRPEREAK